MPTDGNTAAQSTSTRNSAAAAPGNILPGLAVRGYMLAVLTMVAALGIFDRQLMTMLVEPVRHELRLSDTQIGLLTGLAFTLVYALAAMPIARLADRSSRRRIIAVAMTCWSVMTAVCGLAQNFMQLFLARVGVGLGYAGCGMPTHALISDIFPRAQRGTAMAVYLLGVPIGTTVGLALGGWILSHHGWRAAFYVAGIPGIVIAVLLFTMREVRKGASDGVAQELAQLPLLETLRTLWSIRTLPLLILGAALLALVGAGLSSWAPAFLMRVHGLAPAAVGAGLGAAMGLGSLIGHTAGGPLADWLGRKDVRFHLWIAIATAVAAGIIGVLAFTSSASAFIPLIGVLTAVTGIFAAPMVAMTMTLAPVTARATASGCSLIIINIVGLGLGPALVGTISDLLRPRYGVESLRMALLSLLALALPAAWLFLRAGRYYRADLAAAEVRMKLTLGN